MHIVDLDASEKEKDALDLARVIYKALRDAGYLPLEARLIAEEIEVDPERDDLYDVLEAHGYDDAYVVFLHGEKIIALVV